MKLLHLLMPSMRLGAVATTRPYCGNQNYYSQYVDPYAQESTAIREAMRDKHNGTEIRILYLAHQECFIVEKMRNFEKLTGAIVRPVYIGTNTWYEDVVNDVKTEKGWADLYPVSGTWLPTFAQFGGLQDISNEVRNKSVDLEWDDIFPSVIQGVHPYKGKIYAIPLDGDTIYMLYRKDLVEDKGLPTPRSWDDV